ncbi:MAG: DUF2156 domain-containing protein [Chloroflexi bacterium]|nr:DUF2156 domain-containing protein [Chloroflexota bacterium]
MAQSNEEFLYPHFKKVTLADKGIFDQFTRQYPPYSDFNFWSLLGWNTHGRTCFSILNDNLIIKTKGYFDDTDICSLLGASRINETIAILLEDAPRLELVPEIVVQCLETPNNFVVGEDPDNHDYLLAIDDLIKLNGRRFKSIRSKTHRFKKEYPDHKIEVLNANNGDDVRAMIELTALWSKSKGFDEGKSQEDIAVLCRFLQYASEFTSRLVGLFIGNRLIGYTINEIVHDHTALGHLGKTDLSFDGGAAYMECETARLLREQKCIHLNLEQDTGIANMRQAKLAYRPVGLLRKFTIARA